MNAFILTREDRLVNVISVTFAFLVLLATLYPFYWCFIMAFNDGLDSVRGYIYFFPRKVTTRNFQIILSDPYLGYAFVITVARTAIGAVLTVFFTAMVSYGLSKPHLMFRKTYTAIFIVTMYFGGGLIPFYLLLRALGLLNTFWVYIIPTLFNYYSTLLFMAFFRELPESLEESARVDGASDFLIFRRIVIPLSTPILATIGLFAAVYHWNDWFSSNYYVHNTKLWTLPTILMRVLSTSEALKRIRELDALEMRMQDPAYMLRQRKIGPTINSVRYATLIITVFPIVVVYPFLQKYFVKGIMLGAIKA